ncbi:hypothetical protein HanIR_Chr12g0586221 [Helianthus annuus]|nr:hypothetical protein HanIR_Chr12g0586221 [Helianthus annuus]
MRDCFVFLGSFKRQVKYEENDRQNPLLIVNDNGYATAADELNNPTAAMTLILKSWLSGHWFRYLILVMCSPLLIPLVCVFSPFICVAEVCFCFCRRRRLKSDGLQPPPVVPTPVPRQQEDVKAKEKVSLLDRYLDDQLELALEILDECSGDLGFRYDCIDEFDDNRSNSLC